MTQVHMIPIAVAEFGSVCRGNQDAASDHDLLVVGPGDVQARLRQHYESRGFSVTGLTPRQLYDMEKSGALFIAHLQEQGRILYDSEDFLASFLEGAERIPASSEELGRCRESIGFLASTIPRQELAHWSADFLYCLLRDLLVKESSIHGRIAFGVDQLDGPIRRKLGLAPDATDALKRLRMEKARFRKQDAPSPEVGAIVNHALRTWAPLLGRVTTEPTWTRRPEVLLDREFASRYERIRTLEACTLIGKREGIPHAWDPHLSGLTRSLGPYGSTRAYARPAVDLHLNLLVEGLRAC